MKFTIDKHEKYILFKLDETRLDSMVSPKLKTELILINAEGQRNIILDLSTVESVHESSDLSSLLVGHRLCEKAQGVFIVVGLNDSLSHLMSVSQLEHVLIMLSTVEEAIDFIFMEEIEKELNREASAGEK
ncbi:MAG: STAS domain-containing protein [Sphingobacteriaceae bacterium]|nr:MAG: anti-sigma factor antagonist [Pedobacter sp.]